jgi:TolB-like protein/class 3 adenylate cyclase
MEQVSRKLAAILAADVAGYSRLVSENEEETLRTLNAYRATIADLVAEHSGRVFAAAGDSVVAEFASPVQAVRTAVAVQRALDRHNADLAKARQMHFRIGINLGDVVFQDGDLLGDGVNVAARLEQMAVPGGILISGSVLEQIEGKLTFPFHFEGERTAKNISRPIKTYRVDWTQPDMLGGGASGAPMNPAMPNKPSIAVLPFTNMGSDAEQDYFTDGISEDIITALAKWRWLFVIARNTSFVYKGQAVDIKALGRELGVRYVLEGSVRKAGNRVRITAQLIEAARGTHIWSERYDRDLADVFAVQDEITESVVGAIEPELLQVERDRAARRSREGMDVWDHYARGMWLFYQFKPEHHDEAVQQMHLAIERDPTSAYGHMGLARVLNSKVWWGFSTDPEAERTVAYAASRRAAEIDDRDSYVQYGLAWTSLLMSNQEEALAAAQKSIDLTPNFALGYFALSIARVFLGRPEQAADPFQRAMRLSPHEPLTFFFSNFQALAQYQLGRYEEAALITRQAIAMRPFETLYRTLAAVCGQLGRHEEAETALAEMARLMPPGAARCWEFAYPYADPTHHEHFLEGLRKAGLPE